MPHKRPLANKRKGGRPKVPIDWDRVGQLCAAGCYGGSIAHDLGIAVDTLYVRCQQEQGQDFTAFRMAHVTRGDDILRLKQFDMAVKGNERMLIWLGKNRLNQRDKTEVTGNNGTPLPVIEVVVRPPSENVTARQRED